MIYRLADSAPKALLTALGHQGWREWNSGDPGDAWCVYWKCSKFSEAEMCGSQPHQRFNHLPKSGCICTKDSLAKIMRSYRQMYGSVYNFVPESFLLPTEKGKFMARHKWLQESADGAPLWICKPTDQSRGRNIYLIRGPSELFANRRGMLVQKYIDRPLLLGGYKFDLRIYVLVTSAHPLTAYIYKNGLARMATQKYNNDEHGNVFSHLTNASINKHSPTYGVDKDTIGPGCKWSLTQLWGYLSAMGYEDMVGEGLEGNLLWQQIKQLIVLTLLPLTMKVPSADRSSSRCFELFGFDVMIDEALKPWLLEVNSSPSLGVDCTLDAEVKVPMLRTVLKVVADEEATRTAQDARKPVPGAECVESWRPCTAPTLATPVPSRGRGLTISGRCFGQVASVRPQTVTGPLQLMGQSPLAMRHQQTGDPFPARPATADTSAAVDDDLIALQRRVMRSCASEPQASQATDDAEKAWAQPRQRPMRHRKRPPGRQLANREARRVVVGGDGDGDSTGPWLGLAGGEDAEARSVPWPNQKTSTPARLPQQVWASSSGGFKSHHYTVPQPVLGEELRSGTAKTLLTRARTASSGLPPPKTPMLNTKPPHKPREVVTSRIPASAHARRSRLKCLPMFVDGFERIFPFSDASADLAIHLKPMSGGRDATHIVRQVVEQLQRHIRNASNDIINNKRAGNKSHPRY